MSTTTPTPTRPTTFRSGDRVRWDGATGIAHNSGTGYYWLETATGHHVQLPRWAWNDVQVVATRERVADAAAAAERSARPISPVVAANLRAFNYTTRRPVAGQ